MLIFRGLHECEFVVLSLQPLYKLDIFKRKITNQYKINKMVISFSSHIAKYVLVSCNLSSQYQLLKRDNRSPVFSEQLLCTLSCRTAELLVELHSFSSLLSLLCSVFLFSFFQTFYFIGVQPTNNVVIVSGKQQRDSAMHIHLSLLPCTPSFIQRTFTGPHLQPDHVSDGYSELDSAPSLRYTEASS